MTCRPRSLWTLPPHPPGDLLGQILRLKLVHALDDGLHDLAGQGIVGLLCDRGDVDSPAPEHGLERYGVFAPAGDAPDSGRSGPSNGAPGGAGSPESMSFDGDSPRSRTGHSRQRRRIFLDSARSGLRAGWAPLVYNETSQRKVRSSVHLGPPLLTKSRTFIASSATLALKAGLCFLRSLDISRSSSTAVAALSLGAEFPLCYLSSFPGPPHSVSRYSRFPLITPHDN